MQNVNPENLIEVECPYLNFNFNRNEENPVLGYKTQIFLDDLVSKIICPRINQKNNDCSHTSETCLYSNLNLKKD